MSQLFSSRRICSCWKKQVFCWFGTRNRQVVRVICWPASGQSIHLVFPLPSRAKESSPFSVFFLFSLDFSTQPFTVSSFKTFFCFHHIRSSTSTVICINTAFNTNNPHSSSNPTQNKHHALLHRPRPCCHGTCCLSSGQLRESPPLRQLPQTYHPPHT